MRNTLITNHGRHRQSAWLGFRPVTVLLVLLALLVLAVVVAPSSASAAPGVQAEYRGSRWQHASRPICVQTKDIRTTAIKDAVKRSVSYWNANTKLELRVRYDCSSYSQRIKVFDRYYSKKASGWVVWGGGFVWFQSKTAGPWTAGDGWTYAHKSPVYVKINRNYTNGMSTGARQHAVSHELGHALGLGHQATCKSVMVDGWGCDYLYKYGGWRDWTGTTSNPGINTIYANG